ncbi:FAD:protein FMN transferase [Marmoricola sp. URHA0025 HA25]
MTTTPVVGARPDATRYVDHVMGMPISLALRGRHTHDHQALEAWSEVMADLREVDRVFSTYRPDSHVSRLGRGEITVADCPSEVVEVLALGHRARLESGGAFDVRRRAADGRVVLDPSGVVKGWAVERAAAWLHALGDTDFCLSAGGDMVCHVEDPDSPAWRIGIEHPGDTTRLVDVVELRQGALATSGAAHRGDHIVDARSGRVPARVASVTVIAESLTWADIDATAAYALDGHAATWLRTRAGRTGLVVWADGTVERIPGQRDGSSTGS